MIPVAPARRRFLARAGAFALAPVAAHASDRLLELGYDPYVPTPQVIVEHMLELAEVKPEDFVIDLGSGDGRIVVAAAKQFGARALGVEIDKSLVEKAEATAREAGVADRVRFVAQDLYDTALAEASVLTLYLLPETNRRLVPKILAEMKPGARVVSHQFPLGDWPPNRTISVTAEEAWSHYRSARDVMLWIVPARVAGGWILRAGSDAAGIEMAFRQRFQGLAAAADDAAPVKLRDGELRGQDIRFVIDAPAPYAAVYVGRVEGHAMRGRYRKADGAEGDWRATRR